MRRMRSILKGLPALTLVAAYGCATLPTGPSTMSLPGSRKTFDEFRADDAVCRGYALQQVGGSAPSQVATDTTVASAAIGTAVGAAAGAAIGGGEGAAVGAGTGLLFGSVIGASAAQGSYYASQQRFDHAYNQCMYAKGNKIPVSAQFVETLPRVQPPRDYPNPPPPNAPPPRLSKSPHSTDPTPNAPAQPSPGYSPPGTSAYPPADQPPPSPPQPTR